MPSIGQTSVVGEEHIDYAHQLGPLSAGFQAGYNHVTASGLLLGVEADFSFPAILRSNLQQNIAALGPSVVNDNVKIFGSLGGRVGYVFGDWLVYGTGGFAYDRDRLNTTDFASGSVGDNVYFWRPGWTAGAGVEVLLTANLSAKLEYAFFDFTRANAYLPVAGEHYNSDLTFQTVLLGLNYRFNDNPVAPGTTGGILPQSVRDNMSIHMQSTFIGQTNAPFPAAYTGTNSLEPTWQTRDTFSVTGFFGYKEPYTGTEFYYNPEPFQGFGLANTHGLAGFSDIEAQKAGFDFPQYNTARLFLRHVFGLGGDQEDIADGPNQVAGKEDISRLTFTFGKLSIPDIFDNNSYSHDGRVGFMNWALVDFGAFNYSADQQGYTYGTVLDLNQKDWAVRAGYFLVPDVSNGENFDTRLFVRGQYIVEVQHNYSLLGAPGVLRVTGFEEQFYAGSYAATLTARPGLLSPARAAAEPVFKVPPLGYGFDALEPYIDALTMTIHHDRHHGAYVAALNGLIEKYPGLATTAPVKLLTDLTIVPEAVPDGVTAQTPRTAHVSHQGSNERRPHARIQPPDRRHPGQLSYRGSMAGLHVPLPTLRRHPRECPRTARGRCGSLLLHRSGSGRALGTRGSAPSSAGVAATARRAVSSSFAAGDCRPWTPPVRERPIRSARVSAPAQRRPPVAFGCRSCGTALQTRGWP